MDSRNILSKATNAHVLVVVPKRAMVAATVALHRQHARTFGLSVEVGDSDQVLHRKTPRSISVVTPENLLRMLALQPSPSSHFDLVVLEEMQLLDTSYELAVSILRHSLQAKLPRFLALSHSLVDPTDLAGWVGVDTLSLFSFLPKDRPQPLTTHIHTFAVPHSSSLMKTMIKPCHNALRGCLQDQQGLVFVSSRSQGLAIAQDLLTRCVLESDTQRTYRPKDIREDDLEASITQLQDRQIVDLIIGGVGVIHENLTKSDRSLILRLYLQKVLRVLVVSRGACWSLPVRAETVVVMGTQYIAGDASGNSRQLRDYELSEIVAMQSRAIQTTHAGSFYLFCQVESKETIAKFLNDGLPLESQLLETDHFVEWCISQKARVQKRQDIVDILCFTYLARRMGTNPSYYGCPDSSLEVQLSHTADELATKMSLS